MKEMGRPEFIYDVDEGMRRPAGPGNFINDVLKVEAARLKRLQEKARPRSCGQRFLQGCAFLLRRLAPLPARRTTQDARELEEPEEKESEEVTEEVREKVPDFLASIDGQYQGGEKMTLSFSNSGLTEAQAHALALALAERCSVVKELKLDVSFNPCIGVEGARKLAAALADASPNLEAFALLFNCSYIGKEGAAAVAEELSRTNLWKLELNLEDNALGKDGAAAVTEHLSRCGKLVDLSLDSGQPSTFVFIFGVPFYRNRPTKRQLP